MWGSVCIGELEKSRLMSTSLLNAGAALLYGTWKPPPADCSVGVSEELPDDGEHIITIDLAGAGITIPQEVWVSAKFNKSTGLAGGSLIRDRRYL